MWIVILSFLGKIKGYLIAAGGLLAAVFYIFIRGKRAGRKKVIEKVKKKTEETRAQVKETNEQIEKDLRSNSDDDNRKFLRKLAADRKRDK